MDSLYLLQFACFIAMGIYNIEATHANRRKMNIVCTCIYAAIIAAFCTGYGNSGNLSIGSWLYVMLVLFGADVAYCISYRGALGQGGGRERSPRRRRNRKWGGIFRKLQWAGCRVC